jgi:uncharacterized protein YjbI with pentapeptide repeats
MSANLPRRRRPPGEQEPAQRRDAGEARLWHIGTALAVSFTVAVLGLAALAWLAWVLVSLAGFRRHGALSLHDTVGVLQLVFATVAGAGALVALIVAYRRQKIAEAESARERARVFNERFTTIATQLGADQPAVRLAGVHAMSGLADDWKENRQTCVDVLCAYLRLPYDPDPGEGTDPGPLAAYRANREVRHTIIRLIGTHLRPGVAVSWQGLNLDFTGVVFDGGDFSGAQFSGGDVRFDGATFSGGKVQFEGATFSGAEVNFAYTEFSGGEIDFYNATFSGGKVSFGFATFSGRKVRFDAATFSGTEVYFGNTAFSSGEIHFDTATFSGGEIHFYDADFSGGQVSFTEADFSGGQVAFTLARFSGGQVDFGGAKFSGGEVHFVLASFSGADVHFDRTEFSGGWVNFHEATFSSGRVSFRGAEVLGGYLDFRAPIDWSHPPVFDWAETPPPGVMLPTDADATPT